MKSLIISIFFSVLAFANITDADQLSETQKKLQAISDKVSAIERDIAKHTQNRDKLRSEMTKLDGQVGQLHREIHQLGRQATSARRQLKQFNQKDKQLRNELTSQGSAFKQQVRMAYLAQRQNKLQLALSQASLQDASRMAVMYDYINQARIRQIQHLHDLAREVQRNRMQLQDEQARLQQLIQQQTAHQKVLQQARGQKELAQLSLVKLIEQGQGQLQTEQANQRAIKKLLHKLRKQAVDNSRGEFASSKGKLRWPVKGELLNRYGTAKKGSSKIAWSGVSIKAPRGTEIHAIFSGIVAFSDWFQGLGWLLIIEHGGGFMSLYAHADGLYKNVGEDVQQGEIIALVGDSGNAVKTNLYFEIRRQGAPVDPADWCTTPKLAYSSSR